MPYIAKSAWLPVVHWMGTGDVALVVLVLNGQTKTTNDTESVPANLRRQSILPGHGGVTRHSKLATR